LWIPTLENFESGDCSTPEEAEQFYRDLAAPGIQREMARSSQRDENYESKKRALQAAIQELRKMISANAQ
jgi:hypothetical protein